MSAPREDRPPVRFRDLHPIGKVSFVIMGVLVAVVLTALVALAGKAAVVLFEAAWRGLGR